MLLKCAAAQRCVHGVVAVLDCASAAVLCVHLRPSAWADVKKGPSLPFYRASVYIIPLCSCSAFLM